MAEDCDPAVLHARVSVLENDNKRHEGEISQLWGKVSALEICAASLPEIKDSLRSISTKVESLATCTTKNQAEKDGKAFAFLSLREWLLAGVAIASMVLEYLILKGDL